MARPIVEPSGKQPQDIVGRALDRDTVRHALESGGTIDLGREVLHVGTRNVGENLREARLRANLTQKKAAEKSGVSIRTVRRVEAGEVVPAIETVAALASAYDADLAWVLGILSDDEARLLHGYRLASYPRRKMLLSLCDSTDPAIIDKERTMEERMANEAVQHATQSFREIFQHK